MMSRIRVRAVMRMAPVLLAAFVSVSVSPPSALAKEVRMARQFSGSFLTDVAGSSVTQPPYIQVIRSSEGLEYLLSKFERHKNRITKRRIEQVRSRFSKLDYSKKMVIGVFSQPMDNYKLTIDKILMDEEGKAIEVKVSYRHKIKNPAIPPKKSIHFVLAAIPKSDYPVILQATQILPSRKKGAPKIKMITVTGRLMPLSDEGLQLVPVVIKRGNKNSYYIKGAQTAALAKHVGKVVTLRGVVSRERNSPYEWDFTVKKVVKIFN